MKIKEKISPLLPYLKEIKFSENLILIGGAFYPKWIIQESKNPLVKIHKIRIYFIGLSYQKSPILKSIFVNPIIFFVNFK